jgi:hypothetical protein
MYPLIVIYYDNNSQFLCLANFCVDKKAGCIHKFVTAKTKNWEKTEIIKL